MEATIHLQPSLPGTPLHTLSPDRINIQAQRTPVASMQQDLVSPAGPSLLSSGNLPDRLVRSHRRTGSDVQNKVAKFDGLTKESVERRKKDEAALKRAVLGREEAEDEVRLLKEEGRRYREAWEDERAKLERVVGRLEDVTDDLHAAKEDLHRTKSELQRTKEVQSHSQNLYEKEVRRAKKDAFKYSSAYVKLQEELKATRLSLRVLQSDFDSQRSKTEKHEQDAFAAKYKLVGAQEDLLAVQEKVKIVGEERDALKTNVKEEEVARIAAGGRIALPMSRDGDDFDSSPRRGKPEGRLNQLQQANDLTEDAEDHSWPIQRELAYEQKRRIDAEEMIDFMKMECQYQNCSCRVAERIGEQYVHDAAVLGIMAPFLGAVRQISSHAMGPPRTGDEAIVQHQLAQEIYQVEEQHQLAFSESTGTFRTNTPSRHAQTPSAASRPALETAQTEPRQKSSLLPEDTSLLSLLSAPILAPHAHSLPSPPPQSQASEQQPRFHQRSYTTTVPLADNSGNEVFSPRTMTREEAIEQIRQRRGRARSMANTVQTPKKQMVDPADRRDISAPAVRSAGRIRSREIQ